MPATKRAAAKPARKAPLAPHKENDRLIRRITDSLDVAQADLGKLRGSVGSGVSDLRRDLAKMLRDARRHAQKLGTATRKDLERLQKDMASAAKIKPGARRAAPSRNSSAKAATKRKAAAKRKTR